MALVEVQLNNIWYALPSPDMKTYNAYPNIREESSENALGDLVRKIVSVRWKIEQTWSQLSEDEYALLMKLKFFTSFPCKFWSPAHKDFIIKEMYAGDISANGIIQNDSFNITQLSRRKT